MKKGTLIVNGIDYSNGGGGSGGGSASIDYGDKDAFDEWSATAENGEMFVRTDDNEGGDSSSGEIYDDTERVIGSWFGKPIYRKVLTGITPSDTNEFVLFSTTDIDKMINMYGFIQDLVMWNSDWDHINHNYKADCFYQRLSSTSQKIKAKVGSSITNKSYFLVIEYTKVGE